MMCWEWMNVITGMLAAIAAVSELLGLSSKVPMESVTAS